MEDKSLASESTEVGGGFSSNRGQRSENTKDDSKHQSKTLGSSKDASSRRKEDETSFEKPQSETEQGGTAPSYVNAAQSGQESKPKGKNLTEGFGDEDESKFKDGTKLAFESEIGGKNDPARAAVDDFEFKEGSGGTEGALSGVGYAALNNEEES